MAARHAWLALALAALAAVLGALAWRPGPGASEPPSAGVPVPGAWVLADGALAGPVAAEATGPEAAPDADACGPGQWAGMADGQERSQAFRQLAPALVTALQASPQPRQQAAGLWLAATPFAADPGGWRDCEGAACQAALRRAFRQMERHVGEREQARQALATLALGSSDAGVVALGLQVCEQSGSAEEACRLALATRWTALEPDNAAAWLTLAHEAQGRGDASGVANALHAATQAARYQPVSRLVLAEVVAAIPPGVQGAARQDLLTAGISAALAGATPMVAAMEHCRGVSEADPNRRQLCSLLAERLLGQAQDLVDLRFALALGRLAGLPDARLAPVAEDLQALSMLASTLEVPGGASEAACRATQRVNAHVARWARQGELAALRALREPPPR